MSKAENPSGADAGDAKLSWREREMVAALKRLANAQLQVAQIEAQLAETPRGQAPVEIDPADAVALEATVAELAKLSKKSQSRFGGGAARERVTELESKQRLVLDRIGFASYDEYVTARDAKTSGPAAAAGVDPVVERFARRELAAAEATYRDLLLMPDDAGADDDVDDAPGGETGPGENGSAPTIDLTG